MRCASVMLMAFLAVPAVAVADDDVPKAPDITPAQLTGFLVIDVPTPPPVSLRLEAIRAVNENWENSWRYPQPGEVLGIQGGVFYVGDYMYSPRTKRSGTLRGASIGATLLGEILIGSGSPLAGVGALLTGATLDAAAADADRDAEARRR